MMLTTIISQLKLYWLRLLRSMLEPVMGILLAIAGIAISWSGYQSSLWDGIQATAYNRATIVQQESLRSSIEADQLQLIDMAIFIQWLHAYTQNDTAMANFYRMHFRPPFALAFNAWVASGPLKNSTALPTPFAQKEYKIKQRDEAAKRNKEAEQLFADGKNANNISDNYVRTTVVLGMVMFFIGIGQQFKTNGIRFFLTVVSLLILVIGLSQLVGYPITFAGE